jgi:hypothetical protein
MMTSTQPLNNVRNYLTCRDRVLSGVHIVERSLTLLSIDTHVERKVISIFRGRSSMSSTPLGDMTGHVFLLSEVCFGVAVLSG